MINIKVINITWEKILFNQDEINKHNNTIDAGLYQIYGQHPAYGKDALLYIGQASNFASRLNNRSEFIESCSIPTSIRLGRITNSTDPNHSSNTPIDKKWEIINIAEKILIKSHTPAFNKQENSGLFSPELKEFKGQHYIILNWEDYGDLLPEISTLKFSYCFWSFDSPMTY